MGEIAKITFHGAELVVQKGETPETTYVAMKPVVEGMGVSWQGQHDKLAKHPILAPTIKEILMVAEDGKERLMTALPLNRLHFWMATLHPNKVTDPHVREKVIIFQTEAADALFDKFFGRAMARTDVSNGSVGGVVKGIITKHDREVMMPEIRGMVMEALTFTLPSMVEREFQSNARIAALEYVSVRGLLDEAKAVSKGRGRLNRKVGWELRSRALLTVPPIQLRRCPHSGVWLFPREFAMIYMGERGMLLVLEHNEGQGRQTVIRFPKGGGART